jgi:hypothetical protein
VGRTGRVARGARSALSRPPSRAPALESPHVDTVEARIQLEQLPLDAVASKEADELITEDEAVAPEVGVIR